MLPEDRLKEMARQIKRPTEEKLTRTPPKDQEGRGGNKSVVDVHSRRLATYTTLTCLICSALSCQTHGDSVRDESVPGYHQYIHQPLVTTYEDIIRKRAATPASPGFGIEETPCGPNCHLVDSQDRHGCDASPDQVATIERMVISLIERKRRPCTIAFFVGLPCWKVQREIQQLEPRTVELLVPGRTKQLCWYNNQNKSLESGWHNLTKTHLHQERCQANPVSPYYLAYFASNTFIVCS